MNIFWFRRDLRLEDNHGLYESLKSGRTQAIFIFDKSILNELSKDDARVTFLHQQLNELNVKLKEFGASIKCYFGKPFAVWKKIVEDFEVTDVFINKDYEPYAINRDVQISEYLNSKGISIHQFKDQVIFEEFEVVKDDLNPYTIYTPYKKKWLIRFNGVTLFDVSKYNKNWNKSDFELINLSDFGFIESEIKVIEFNFKNVHDYDLIRNFPAKDMTSYLSPHLRFGTISVRECVNVALEKNETFLSELIWREFFMQIMFHFPNVVTDNFKPKYNGIQWRNNKDDFKKWCNGETGYPLVDAGMRQLNSTGYMHNRVRMVTASFLIKHLLIDWRWGEAYFAKKLLDFDLSANNGNWQWSAGTGCDSSPYFRIFNPIEQLKKFDKDLIYTRKWVKDFDELTYPKPMVDHKEARERCLLAYKSGIG